MSVTMENSFGQIKASFRNVEPCSVSVVSNNELKMTMQEMIERTGLKAEEVATVYSRVEMLAA